MSFYFLILILISLLLFYIYTKLTKKYNLYDNSNEFGKKLKVPTGAGIIFYITTFLSLIILYKLIKIELQYKVWPLVFSISTLMFVSFYDDFKPINPIFKLILQLLFVYSSLASIDLWALNIPLKVAIFFVVILWVYTINIINFIDGADGFLAIFSISFFLILFIASEKYSLSFLSTISITLLPILISFIFFNKPDAILYMGDTGSVFLGYIIGYASIELIINGYWFIVITLLGYPLCDCTLTLIKKTIKGNLPWARMFDYFFLMPIKKKYSLKKDVFNIMILSCSINTAVAACQILMELKYLFILSLIINFFTIWKYYRLGKKQLAS